VVGNLPVASVVPALHLRVALSLSVTYINLCRDLSFGSLTAYEPGMFS